MWVLGFGAATGANALVEAGMLVAEVLKKRGHRC